MILQNLKVLSFKSRKLKTLPEQIGQLQRLEVLNLIFFKNLEKLPKSICQLKNLKDKNKKSL